MTNRYSIGTYAAAPIENSPSAAATATTRKSRSARFARFTRFLTCSRSGSGVGSGAGPGGAETGVHASNTL